MNDTTRYVLDAIRSHVWSGFDSPADVDRVIDDLLEGDADEALLRAAVGPEFARKQAAEATWPPTTDCDRLDAAFTTLDAQGIIALQNTGYEMSDGLTEVAEALHRRGGREGVGGYCFYHGQDLERGEGRRADARLRQPRRRPGPQAQGRAAGPGSSRKQRLHCAVERRGRDPAQPAGSGLEATGACRLRRATSSRHSAHSAGSRTGTLQPSER